MGPKNKVAAVSFCTHLCPTGILVMAAQDDDDDVEEEDDEVIIFALVCVCVCARV